jgi:hypothetical protein
MKKHDFCYSAIPLAATVDENVTNVTITSAVLAGKYESMTINGKQIDSGAPFEASLNKGENRFLIAVTASDKTAKTYTLTLTRGNTVKHPFSY